MKERKKKSKFEKKLTRIMTIVLVALVATYSTIFYFVATPIGNLNEINQRLIEVFNESDFIACEDTRVTQKILLHLNIHKNLISFTPFLDLNLGSKSASLESLKDS